MTILVTYPNHFHFIPAKDQDGSVNFYRYKFGNCNLRIVRQTVPLIVLHHHREVSKPCAAQVAAFCCDVGAGTLEVVGGVVKGVVMWISIDGTEAFSQRLT